MLPILLTSTSVLMSEYFLTNEESIFHSWWPGKGHNFFLYSFYLKVFWINRSKCADHEYHICLQNDLNCEKYSRPLLEVLKKIWLESRGAIGATCLPCFLRFSIEHFTSFFEQKVVLIRRDKVKISLVLQYQQWTFLILPEHLLMTNNLFQ